METQKEGTAHDTHDAGLETKYRDIADGNLRQEPLPGNPCGWLETKYRDIADGNQLTTTVPDGVIIPLETKYRDIADGNNKPAITEANNFSCSWKPSTAI